MTKRMERFKELVNRMPMVGGLQYGYICTECPKKSSVENQRLMDTPQLICHFREHHNMTAEDEFEKNWVHSKAYLIDRRPKAHTPKRQRTIATNASIRRQRFREANNNCDPLRMNPLTSQQDETTKQGVDGRGFSQSSMSMPEPNPLFQGHIQRSMSTVPRETYDVQDPRETSRQSIFQPGTSHGTSYVSQSFFPPVIHDPNFPLPIVATIPSHGIQDNVAGAGMHTHGIRTRTSSLAPQIKKESSEENFRPAEYRRRVQLEPLSRTTHAELIKSGYFRDRYGEYRLITDNNRVAADTASSRGYQ